ncbi:MAG TPA: DUF4159 domain-containing protein [Longimicrobiales bacterium]|nr:DUF4159 domain-containing protein [Longimicrobiales bacterium]
MIAGRLAAAAAALGLVGAGWGVEETAPLRSQEDPSAYNVPYDARFTFARIRFRTGLRGGGFFRGREAPWAHDYPRAERNFMRILHETTVIEPYLDGGNIFAADDPELFHFPVAYIVEVGYWNPGEAEVESLRGWLEKGGFLIVDDFRGRDWLNFEHQMRRVLPGARLVELDVSHPVFHTFFEIESLDLAPPTFQQFRPMYYGIFEDNDPEKRLMVVANYNNDIGDYWEWSDVGYVPIALSNEAYKLGVNYVIYGMTR